MAFEEVMVRTAEGQEYGPATMEQVQQWHREGRVPATATLIDMQTQAESSVSALLPTIPPPPPTVYTQAPAPTSAPTSMDHMIPTRNPKALAAYYCGVFAIGCAIILGPIALIFGILGLKDAKKVGVGRTHAIVGIVLGSIMTLIGFIFTPMIIMGILSDMR